MTNTILAENPPKKKAANIRADKLHTFEGHPFQVIDNEEMENLAESIQTQGIISPLIVRPMEGKVDEYEVISGHRRLYAAIKAGLTEVPALIYPLDRNQAVIAVVDSNLHREKLLPSEKAFAYKMKLEAISKQGQRNDLTSRQVGAVDKVLITPAAQLLWAEKQQEKRRRLASDHVLQRKVGHRYLLHSYRSRRPLSIHDPGSL